MNLLSVGGGGGLRSWYMHTGNPQLKVNIYRVCHMGFLVC